MTSYILKLVQKSSFDAINSIERFIAVDADVSINAIDRKLFTNSTFSEEDLKELLPEGWDITDLENVSYIVCDKENRYRVYHDDKAYLLNANGDTLKIIHQGK